MENLTAISTSAIVTHTVILLLLLSSIGSTDSVDSTVFTMYFTMPSVFVIPFVCALPFCGPCCSVPLGRALYHLSAFACQTDVIPLRAGSITT